MIPWLAFVPLSACANAASDALGSAVDPGAPPEQRASTFDSVDGSTSLGCTKLDVLFVVDNSHSMFEEQKSLSASFPAFVDALEAYRSQGGELLDYRVAVTTTDDETDRGAFRAAASRAPGAIPCDAGPKRPWLERSDPDLRSAFACRATVGTNGSDLERPLESARLALTDRVQDGMNAHQGEGFVRDDALLAVVLISDEDEGSAGLGFAHQVARSVPSYVGAFDALKKGERRAWAAAVIAGPGPGICTSAELGDAYEALRLKQFVETAGDQAVFHSICEGNLATGLSRALQTFQTACGRMPSPR